MIDLSNIISLGDKLGFFKTIKGKLLRQPDEAAEKLVLVLDEFSKVFLSVENELVTYLSLHFDPAEDNFEERKKLLSLEGGLLEVRVAEMRGHCHKISNIYYKFLQRWFQKVLPSSESNKIEEIFMELNNADEGFLNVVNALVEQLSPKATETLNHLDQGDFQKANELVKAARLEVMTERQAIAKAVVDLRNLQAEFISISRTV